MRQAEAGNEEGTSPLDRARVITEQARHLITRGEPAQAEQALQQAHQLFTTAGAEDEAATVMGDNRRSTKPSASNARSPCGGGARGGGRRAAGGAGRCR
jgi:hypothetical protein